MINYPYSPRPLSFLLFRVSSEILLDTCIASRGNEAPGVDSNSVEVPFNDKDGNNDNKDVMTMEDLCLQH